MVRAAVCGLLLILATACDRPPPPPAPAPPVQAAPAAPPPARVPEVVPQPAPDVVGPLITAVRNGDRFALLQLKAIGSEADARARAAMARRVWDGLKDGSAGLREQMIEALGVLGEHSVPFLTQLVSTTPDRVRESAILQLASLGRKARAAIPALVERVEKTGDRYATQALGRIGVPDPGALKTLFGQARKGNPTAAIALAAIGEPADEIVKLMFELLDRGDRGAAAVFGFDIMAVRATRVVPELLRRVHAGRVGRRAVLEALSLVVHAQDDLPVQKLLEMLDHDDGVVRRISVNGLVRRGEDVVTPLVERLRGDDWQIRISAAVALHRIASGTSDPALRRRAREPLARAMPELIVHIDASHASARKAIIDEMQRIVESGRMSTKQLTALLGHALTRLRDAAVEALVKRGGEGVPDLIDQLASKEWRVRTGAARALQRIAAATNDAVLRARIEDALGINR